MTLRRRETEISVERPVGPDGPAGGVVRLAARLEYGPEGIPPTVRELGEALDGLKADLDGLLGTPLAALPASRPERDLTELVETYRPRQRQLVDLLRDDGEISLAEHVRLVDYLSTSFSAPLPTPSTERPVAKFDQPIAAVPIAAERLPETKRAVADLIRQYQIASLKQAGAVRARRQISFEEYMALKRHFQPAEAAGADRSS